MGMSRLLTEDSLKYYLTSDAVMARPVGWELSLHSGDPGDDGDYNEVDDSTYERQPIQFEVGVSGYGYPLAQNTTAVEFPEAGEGYEVTHIVVWDTTGAMLLSQSLREPRVVPEGGQVMVASGEIKIGAIQ